MRANNRPTIRLWTLDLQGVETPPPAWLEFLDEEERLHCQRFRLQGDRVAYVAAHALLRCTLSRTSGLPPASLIFRRDKMGKPFLTLPECSGIDVSISHTAGMVAVALSEAGKVGVDVEAIVQNNIPSHDLAAYGLSDQEIRELELLSEPEKSEAFFDLWTAREAVAKADGRGLSLPFSLIQIDRFHNTATIPEDQSSPSSHWLLWRERASPLHQLTLAWSNDNGELIRMKPLLSAHDFFFNSDVVF